MIKVANISVSKGKEQILRKISCELQAGKISVVVGKNGAGKSTLLETLCGSVGTEKGLILWENVPSTELRVQDMAKRRAVLSQHIQLNFPIKVRQLVEMGAYVLDHMPTQKELATYVEGALDDVEMGNFVEREFNTLSGGEQKRVLLAKCLLQLSCSRAEGVDQFLFLDEPTASLDIVQQNKLIKRIRQLAKRKNIGIFAILHDLNLSAQFADEVLIMKSGEIAYVGSPAEIFTPKILHETLGIHALIQKHPVYACPHIIPLAQAEDVLTYSSQY